MRVYLNTSAWNRPFDDQSSDRVRSESQAVAAILASAEVRDTTLVGSEYLDFEVNQTPDQERARRVGALTSCIRIRIPITPVVAERARELAAHGLRGLDALHIAAAEAGGASLLVTTDDRMRKAAKRAGAALNLRVVGPVEALAEILEQGRP